MAGPGRRRAAAVLGALALVAGCAAPASTPASVPAPGADASARPSPAGTGPTGTPPTGPASAAERGIREALDRRAAAVLRHDVPPDDPAARTLGRLAAVPLATWAYRVLGVVRDGPRAVVRVELAYALDGHDAGPVTTGRVLELAERDGRWRVTADRPADGAAAQIWEQGPVRVVRGARALVLGAGQDPALLREVAATADRALPAVTAAWPGRWSGRVVVLVPGSLDAMAALLGGPADAYRGTAAVTTGRPGGGVGAPADRVVVNPEAYRELSGFGRRFVLTHETVHVATRTATTAATPLWLSEGLADRIAYRGTGRPAADAAPELARAVRAGDVPAALPADGDFSFGGDAGRVARAYEGGWLACELIARRWGGERLAAFYRAAGERGQDRAFRDVLATDRAAFTRAWRDHLRQELSSAPS
ncbi:hypothetical protein [Streptomyces kanasensis]|uniref:hypothetical protein n=1 Tax=Streptomyces kanasensis TaxID=936756 RepID=UPI003821E328